MKAKLTRGGREDQRHSRRGAFQKLQNIPEPSRADQKASSRGGILPHRKAWRDSGSLESVAGFCSTAESVAGFCLTAESVVGFCLTG